jgi:hypothetical protein
LWSSTHEKTTYDVTVRERSRTTASRQTCAPRFGMRSPYRACAQVLGWSSTSSFSPWTTRCRSATAAAPTGGRSGQQRLTLSLRTLQRGLLACADRGRYHRRTSEVSHHTPPRRRCPSRASGQHGATIDSGARLWRLFSTFPRTLPRTCAPSGGTCLARLSKAWPSKAIARVLTHAQLRRLLGFGSRVEAGAFLKQHGVYLEYSLDDLDRDTASSRGVR